MEITSRPFELNAILTNLTSNVDLIAATLCRSKDLNVMEAGLHLKRMAAEANVSAAREMQLEPEIESD